MIDRARESRMPPQEEFPVRLPMSYTRYSCASVCRVSCINTASMVLHTHTDRQAYGFSNGKNNKMNR